MVWELRDRVEFDPALVRLVCCKVGYRQVSLLNEIQIAIWFKFWFPLLDVLEELVSHLRVFEVGIAVLGLHDFLVK